MLKIFSRKPEAPPKTDEVLSTPTHQLLTSADMTKLYSAFNAKLLAHVIGKGLPRAEAEEVVQESFVRLLKLENNSVASYMQAYLFKIATNLAIDRLRRKTNGPEVCLDISLLEDPVDDSASPESQHRYGQLLERVEESIKDLPDKCQMAFMLYKVRGMSYGDVASRMNITESMVRKHVLRAVRHCYDAVKDDL